MPHASITANFSCAVPLPPEMMAPACPIRLPGGAVTPAMNPTTGLVMFSLIQRAQVSSSSPPISPTMITASVCGSSLNIRITSMCFRPLTGSPPMPTQVDGARGERRRHVDHRHRRSGFLLGLAGTGENRDALEVLSGLVGIDAGHETVLAVGVLAAQARVEGAGLAGDALGHHLGVPVDQDAHNRSPI